MGVPTVPSVTDEELAAMLRKGDITEARARKLLRFRASADAQAPVLALLPANESASWQAILDGLNG